ncbi:sensor histidine kinase [Brachybacterium hainanense]|uniref:histidine kinase n=1 Tax=Brachybacterium hainanense TaxID=1541174 RepID=A0ABV6RD98_9MICO
MNGGAEEIDEMLEESGEARRRPRISVRLRILQAVLLVAALGMIVAGGTSYLIARQQTQADVYGALRQEAEEFRSSTRVATEEGTGLSITTLSDLLQYSIKTTYPNDDEAVLGIIDGRVRWVPGSDDPGYQRSIEQDAELIAAAASVAPGQSPGVYRISTPSHRDLAYISVPVQLEGSSELGHYVTAVDMTTAFDSLNRAYLAYAGVAAATLLLLGLVGHGVVGRVLAPLRALRTTAQRISEADLGDRIPADQLSSRDEVSDLGRTMNAMLDRLATSFDSQRRFLDDVGHELRTPITIIQGHQELMDVTDPAEVRDARQVTLEELGRMERLVDDLLLLAKSRRPDFVRPAEVDVDEMLVSVLERVTALGERTWTLDSSDGGSWVLDRQRIEQALVQLVSNALRFTEPGAVIALGARRRAGSLRIWVRDEGSGIDPAERDRIFARHATSPAGGVEHPQGMGLGLAIVTAILEAHDGSIELDSVPGRGSRFTMVVPDAEEETAWPRS